MAEDWLKSSIMAKRAVAKGAAGARHSLTIEQQGKFHYVYGPYAEPVLRVKPGDLIVAETEDVAFAEADIVLMRCAWTAGTR